MNAQTLLKNYRQQRRRLSKKIKHGLNKKYSVRTTALLSLLTISMVFFLSTGLEKRPPQLASSESFTDYDGSILDANTASKTVASQTKPLSGTSSSETTDQSPFSPSEKTDSESVDSSSSTPSPTSSPQPSSQVTTSPSPSVVVPSATPPESTPDPDATSDPELTPNQNSNDAAQEATNKDNQGKDKSGEVQGASTISPSGNPSGSPEIGPWEAAKQWFSKILNSIL